MQINVLYCGVCYSDIHQREIDWGNIVYPCIPAHEVVARGSAKSASVSKHQVGDLVRVDCMIDSCRECGPCFPL